MCECSICLNPVRVTRSSKQLECGHLYHSSCIEEWVSAGGDTCPMCRNSMGLTQRVPKYKVTIIIENTETGNTSVDEFVTELLVNRFQGEINFESDTSEEILNIISELGILRRIDIDSLVLDTE